MASTRLGRLRTGSVSLSKTARLNVNMTSVRTYMSPSLYNSYQSSSTMSTFHPVYRSVLSTTPRRALYSSGWRRFNSRSGRRIGSEEWQKTRQELWREAEKMRREARDHKAAMIEEWNQLLSTDPHKALFGDTSQVWTPWTRQKTEKSQSGLSSDAPSAVGTGKHSHNNAKQPALQEEYDQFDKEFDSLDKEFDKVFQDHERFATIDPITNRRISGFEPSQDSYGNEATAIPVKKFEPSKTENPTSQTDPRIIESQSKVENVPLRGFAAQPWLKREGFTADVGSLANSDIPIGLASDPWARNKFTALRDRVRQLTRTKRALETQIAETSAESERFKKEYQRQTSPETESPNPRYEAKLAENTADKDLDQLTAKQLRARMGQKTPHEPSTSPQSTTDQATNDIRQKRIDFLKRSEIPGMHNIWPYTPPVVKTYNPYAVSAAALAANASPAAPESKKGPRYHPEQKRKLDMLDEKERNAIKSGMTAFEAKHQPRTVSAGDLSTTRPFGWKFDPAKDAMKKEAALEQSKRDAALVKEIKDSYEDHYGPITVNHRQIPYTNPPPQGLYDYDAKQINTNSKQAKFDESLRYYDKFSGQPEPLPRASKNSHSNLQSALGQYDSAELAKTTLERSLAAYDNSLNKVTRTLQEGKKRTTEVKDALEEYDRKVLQAPRQFNEEDWESVIMPAEPQQESSPSIKTAPALVEKLEPALARQTSSASTAPQAIAPQPTASVKPEILYSYIALSYGSGKLQVAHSSSTCVEHKPNLAVGTILSRLKEPTAYFEKMAELDKDGYELVAGSRTMLVYRRLLTGSESILETKLSTNGADSAPAASTGPVSSLKQPAASQTVRRAEEVFSGSAVNNAGSAPSGPPPPPAFGRESATRAFRRFRAIRRRWGFFRKSAFFFLVLYLGYKTSVFLRDVIVSARDGFREKRISRTTRKRDLEGLQNEQVVLGGSDDSMMPRIQITRFSPCSSEDEKSFGTTPKARETMPESSASYSTSSDDRSLVDTIAEFQARAHADLVRRAREWHDAKTKDKLGNDGLDRERHVKKHTSVNEAPKLDKRDEIKTQENRYSFVWKWPNDKHEGESERRNQ